MSPKYIVGAIIILVFLVFAGMNLGESLTPYVSIQEARVKGTKVQVKGERVEGSEKYDTERKTFNFKMADPSGEEVQVIYDGLRPSNFERATEVVAIGKYTNGEFLASELLIKCPSKYEAEEMDGVRS